MGTLGLVRRMILGTAGHIDHGKTALVRALTGVDTDRLPEEKRRGITIDLGFAPLRLSNGDTVGVVDVPGHEAFVRTMLAGASGIDLALLVIAADEGPMPQTREHLAILELLSVPRIVVALSKADLVDADWLALVTSDVRELLAPTRYRGAEIIPTSVHSQAGIPQLRRALEQQLSAAAGRAAADVFRMPIDRVFSVKGTGTVVTGTVWSGELTDADAARVLPLGVHARLRGLQTHGAAVGRLLPGTRAAIALAGIETSQLSRGATLVARGDWHAATVLRADVSLLADAPRLGPRTRVRFHLATSDVGARLIAAGSALTPGSPRPVRIVLDEPVVARAGDRFVLRSASPLATIGGGIVTDPHAPRRARPLPETGMSIRARLALFAEEAGLHGLAESQLPVRLGGTASDVARLVAGMTEVLRIGEKLYSRRTIDALEEKVLAQVKSHHAQRPLDSGAPRQDIRSRAAAGAELAVFDYAVSALVAAKRLVAAGADLRAADFGPALNEQQTRLAENLVQTLEAAGHEPPSVAELEARFGKQTHGVLRLLERQHRVVQVEDIRFYAPEAVRELLRRMEDRMSGKGEVAPTELRETLGFSRKFLIPFLEFCDKRGYTVRTERGRVWRGMSKNI